jgi:hypothetical protein
MTDYKATPEQWAAIEKAQAPVEVAPGTFVAGKDHVLSVILLELRARVEALEANSKPTPNLTQIRSSLVEQVAFAIDSAPIGTNDADEARAAIREVAAWLKQNGGLAARVWSEVIEQEAE